MIMFKILYRIAQLAMIIAFGLFAVGLSYLGDLFGAFGVFLKQPLKYLMIYLDNVIIEMDGYRQKRGKKK